MPTAKKTVKANVSLNIHTKGVDSEAAKRLPAGTVKLSGTNGLVINVAKLSRSLMRDQRARMVSSMGCVSNPGGPGC